MMHSVSFSMNFCTYGVIFIQLAKLKLKLWQYKVDNVIIFCADVVDFTDLVSHILINSTDLKSVTDIFTDIYIILFNGR